MKKGVLAVVLALAGVLALQGGGRDAFAFQKGHWELTLGGNGSSDESFDSTIFSAAGSVGHFVTDNFELLLRQDIKYSEVASGDDLWNGGTRIGMDYHFSIEALYPFVGASVGYLYGDTVEEQFVAGPQVGVKFFANSTTFLLGMVEYEFFFNDTSNAKDNYDDGRFVYNVGIGFIW